jgi:hypothetical protein
MLRACLTRGRLGPEDFLDILASTGPRCIMDRLVVSPKHNRTRIPCASHGNSKGKRCKRRETYDQVKQHPLHA